MRVKIGCFIILLLIFTICEVESRPQFFVDTINKLKEKGSEIGCKVHQFSLKPFPHTHNVGSDPCAANPEKNTDEINSINQFSNNRQEKPNSGIPDNQIHNGPPQNNQPNGNGGGNNFYGQSGYGNAQNSPNQANPHQANNGENNQYSHHAHSGHNTDTNEVQSSTHSSNAIVFPGPVDKPKPATHNSQQGPGGRTIIDKPGQQHDARENVNPVQNNVTPASTTSTTAARGQHKKSALNHSSKRKSYSSDYSDEDSDESGEGHKKKKKIIDATPLPESDENVPGVTDGRSLIGKVKTNCPEGYVADRKGRCREAY